jgi:hypothetical protein
MLLPPLLSASTMACVNFLVHTISSISTSAPPRSCLSQIVEPLCPSPHPSSHVARLLQQVTFDTAAAAAAATHDAVCQVKGEVIERLRRMLQHDCSLSSSSVSLSFAPLNEESRVFALLQQVCIVCCCCCFCC